jgi:hypothetical protein
MIAIIIALAVLFLFVCGIAGFLGDRIRKQANNFDTQFKREQEYWASKYHIEFSRMMDKVSKCERLLEELQKDSRIRAMLKKFPALNESFFKETVEHVTNPEYKESDIEIIAEKLNQMVEPFLPHSGSKSVEKKQ